MDILEQSILASPTDLDPKDHPLAVLHNWCEQQRDIVVLNSGLILAFDPTSRSVQNCKILLQQHGIRCKQVVKATQELIDLLLANKNDPTVQHTVTETQFSAQQQRLRMLIHAAVKEQVSDIHIQVRAEVAHVRFRKHGELYLYAEWVPKVAREIAAVAFNKETDHAISHFNPLVPQSASMPMCLDGIDIRLRLASMPAHGGFDMVLRVLSLGDTQVHTLDQLGYTPQQVEIIIKSAQMPYGAIMIAGPTGSGKTTTLASCMQLIRDDRKIYTIEDPVEKLIPNATQVPVNTEKEDRGFANMGKAALRMDPDTIVIGECRDGDTAQVLMRAAMTGHLVFSTIHTNSAVNIVTRLVDLGVSPLLLGDTNLLICLMFQRLIPKLCSYCAKPFKTAAITPEYRSALQQYYGEHVERLYFRGRENCSHCRGLGINGRTVVAEVVWIDEPGREFIQKRDTLGWQKYLLIQGFQTYRSHAIDLVRQGICDPLDAERVVGDIFSRFAKSDFLYERAR